MKKIILLIMVLFASLLIKPIFAKAPVENIKQDQEVQLDFDTMEVLDLVEYFASYYGIDYLDFYTVGKCESNWNPVAVGDNGLAHNVLQIHERTFIGWSNEMGESLDYNSTIDHIKVGAWAFSQGEKYRRAWTAYRALKNGGTYEFYSSLLEKHFVVHCNY